MVSAAAAAAAVAHDRLVTLTKARQHTNTLSPLTTSGAWFIVCVFAELSLEVGFENTDVFASESVEPFLKDVIYAKYKLSLER